MGGCHFCSIEKTGYASSSANECDTDATVNMDAYELTVVKETPQPVESVKAAVIDFIGGTAGGTACVYVGQPLDTVKVKMQTFPGLYSRGMWHCLAETYRRDGIRRGLYAGTVPALAANIAENSILFAAYGFCQKAVAFTFSQKVENMSTIYNATSGFLAGFFSSFTLCPTELVKCRLQALRETSAIPVDGFKVTHSYVGPLGLSRQILRDEGFLGFFRGFTSTLTREMPGYFFFFGGYELTRHLLTPPGKKKDEIGPLRTICAGGVGGVTFWTMIFPSDVIKSRIQINKLNLSMTRCLIDIVEKEGVRALYNGLGPTVIRTFPASGALFLAYEYTKKFLTRVTS